MFRVCCCLLLFVASFATFTANANCQHASSRHFDFWLGKWQVTTPTGKTAGQSHITSILNGCVIKEHYKTPTGYEGESFNIYDKQSQQWHQTWVDNTGLLLKLSGQFEQNTMTLEGDGIAQDGSPVTHRISWTDNDNKTVRQQWQMSKDGGQTWTTLFDGLYSPLEKSKTN